MNSYKYRVTVEALTDQSGKLVEQPRLLSFTTANHDDLLEVARKVRGSETGLDDQEAVALAIGLKLFGEVVLVHRKEPLFAEMQTAMGTFIRELKSRPVRGAIEPVPAR